MNVNIRHSPGPGIRRPVCASAQSRSRLESARDLEFEEHSRPEPPILGSSAHHAAGIAALTPGWARPGLVLLLAFAGGTATAEEADLSALETRWHMCVRQAFTGQPLGMERRAAQRAALAACKPQEDAYVRAMLAAQEEAARARATSGVVARARDWALGAAGSARAALGGVMDRLRR